MSTTTKNTTANTEFKRKAAARKGQATKLRNEADRAGQTSESAETRVRAEAQEATARFYEAGRVLDVATGAVLDARDRVVDTVRPLGTPRQAVREFGEELKGNVSRYEVRGAKTRDQARRDADRALRGLRDRVPV